MKLKILGTQSPYNTSGHNCPGFLIVDGDTKIMLDAGSGSHSMLSFPYDLQNLSIILSHLHRDHYNDVFNMQYASFVFHNQGRIENPISIYLPATPDNIYEDIMEESNSFANYSTIDENSNLIIGNITISFCKTDHPVETYAIKLTDGKQSIVYTSDTSFSCKDKIINFAKGSDLIICESSLLTSYGFPEINSHLTARQAGIIAKESNAKGLILTHFWPEENPEKYVQEAKIEFSKTIAAKEGLIINLDKKQEINESTR